MVPFAASRLSCGESPLKLLFTRSVADVRHTPGLADSFRVDDGAVNHVADIGWLFRERALSLSSSRVVPEATDRPISFGTSEREQPAQRKMTALASQSARELKLKHPEPVTLVRSSPRTRRSRGSRAAHFGGHIKRPQTAIRTESLSEPPRCAVDQGGVRNES